MRTMLAASPALPLVACNWNVRIVLIANVDVVVSGVKNPLRTYRRHQKESTEQNGGDGPVP